MCVNLHSADIFLQINSKSENSQVFKAISITQNVLYYFLFVVAWIISPFTNQFYENRHIYSLKTRIKTSIIEVLKFYIICFIVVIVGIILYFIFDVKKTISFETIFKLLPALTNIYGMFFFTLTIGIELIQLPYSLWVRSSHEMKIQESLVQLKEVNSKVEYYQNDVSLILELKHKARNEIPPSLKDKFEKIEQSNENLLENSIFHESENRDGKTSKQLLKYKNPNFKWAEITDSELEKFFNVIFTTKEKSEYFESVQEELINEINSSISSLRYYLNGYIKVKLYTIAMRILSIFMCLISLFLISTEITHLFGPRVSILYNIFETIQNDSGFKLVFILIITGYLILLGGHSLTYPSFSLFLSYKFFYQSTSILTFIRWGSFIQKLFPTVSYHAQKLIYIEHSSIQELIGKLDNYPTFSKILDFLYPILLLLFSIYFLVKKIQIRPSVHDIQEGTKIYQEKSGIPYEEDKRIRKIMFWKDPPSQNNITPFIDNFINL